MRADAERASGGLLLCELKALLLLDVVRPVEIHLDDGVGGRELTGGYFCRSVCKHHGCSEMNGRKRTKSKVKVRCKNNEWERLYVVAQERTWEHETKQWQEAAHLQAVEWAVAASWPIR